MILSIVNENQEVLIWLQDIFLVRKLNQIAFKIILRNISETRELTKISQILKENL